MERVESSPMRRPIVSVSLSIIAAIVITVVTWIPGNPADTFWLSVVGSGPFVLLKALKIGAAFSLFLMAALLYGQPNKSEKWGKYAVVASVVSIATSSLGGLGVGAAIGIIAGVLAIRWGRSETTQGSGILVES